ncbi:MAG: hypothetical protein R3B70_17345 [Polyangiaceae bacterium]
MSFFASIRAAFPALVAVGLLGACDPASGGGTGGGGAGAGGQGGGGGGGGVWEPVNQSESCGNRVVDPGELCFTELHWDRTVPVIPGAVLLGDLEVADCDGDGDVDVITSSLAALVNDGAGVLSAPVQSELWSSHGPVAVPRPDGGVDLVAMNQFDGRTVMYTAAGACKFELEKGDEVKPAQPRDFVVADLDGDGSYDVAKVFPASAGAPGRVVVNPGLDIHERASGRPGTVPSAIAAAANLLGDGDRSHDHRHRHGQGRSAGERERGLFWPCQARPGRHAGGPPVRYRDRRSRQRR